MYIYVAILDLINETHKVPFSSFLFDNYINNYFWTFSLEIIFYFFSRIVPVFPACFYHSNLLKKKLKQKSFNWYKTSKYHLTYITYMLFFYKHNAYKHTQSEISKKNKCMLGILSSLGNSCSFFLFQIPFRGIFRTMLNI